MDWCRQATSHYLSQWWLRSLSPYGITRPQWVKSIAGINTLTRKQSTPKVLYLHTFIIHSVGISAVNTSGAYHDADYWVWLESVATMSLESLIARFMRPTWGPSGADKTQVGPMLAPWTLLSGIWLYVLLVTMTHDTSKTIWWMVTNIISLVCIHVCISQTFLWTICHVLVLKLCVIWI